MTIHRIAVSAETLRAHVQGLKAHEVVQDPTEAIAVGDTVLLFDAAAAPGEEPGEVARKVSYITSASSPCALSDSGLHTGHSILSLTPP